MKWYQSPLFISGIILIFSGAYYTIRTILDSNDWGMLFGIPALITGGLLIVLHFFLRWLLKATLRHQLITELILLFVLYVLFLILN